MVYQVKLSPTGPWHRREVDPSGIGNGHTACGLPIDGAYLSREHVLDDRLCPVCFTHRERDTGEMKKIEKEALEIKRASELVEQWEREGVPANPRTWLISTARFRTIDRQRRDADRLRSADPAAKAGR